ncbi:MAG: aminotransferase class V-fold PLP-dependent enzyme [Terriglobia bacterium]
MTAPDIYARLGVRTLINAKGTYTFLTGSLVSSDVSEAMAVASRHFVHLLDLQEKAGAKIAHMLGVEAAMVSSGAAAAILLGTAACLTGNDPKRIAQLPDVTGMKSEVIIQKAHRNPFDHAIRNTGVRLVEVESAEEFESAICEKTAMMYFLNAAQNEGKIGLEKWVEVGKRRGIPTFNDAAADVPPVSHLSDYNRMGFDLVAFSGGKGLRGPQCAGLLLGRKDLIEAAILNDCPYEDAVGRPCKVGKEEIVGMFAAVERYLRIDHDAEWKDWEQRVQAMAKILASVQGLQVGSFVPDVANHVPHLYLKWDESALGITKAECAKQLRDGEPSIEVLEDDYPKGMCVTPFMMQPGEELIVACRIEALLVQARDKSKA